MPEPVSHVVKNGSRQHVLSWAALEGPKSDGSITVCSEPLCEVNFIAVHELRRCGIDPAKHLPQTIAALSPKV